MMRTASTMLALVVSLAIVGSVMAAEKKQGAEGKKAGPAPLPIIALAEKLNLTAEQKAKVEELKKEYGPKISEGYKKRQTILTDEQRAAQRAAQQAARDAGKSEAEVRTAGAAAVTLTDEQKKKTDEVQKEIGPVQAELREKVMAVLTSQQQEQLKEEMSKAGMGGRKGKPAAK